MAPQYMTISGFEQFEKLAPLVSLYRPSTEISTEKRYPHLIVLCTWMGAAPKHIAKYTEKYRALFPSSAILLISSSVKDTFANGKAQRSRLLAACQVVRSFVTTSADVNGSDDGGDTAPILLHCMSNGGGLAATRMTALLREEFQLKGKLFHRLILDCMPGKGNVERAITAISVSLPKGFLVRLVARFLLRLVFYTWTFWHCILLHREAMMDKLRRQLNEPSMFPVAIPRLYLYSKADKLIDYREVQEHALLARKAGCDDVTEEVFETAAHCALAQNDGDQYWRSIREFWDRPARDPKPAAPISSPHPVLTTHEQHVKAGAALQTP